MTNIMMVAALTTSFSTWLTSQPNIVKADAIECNCSISGKYNEKVEEIILVETDDGKREIDIFVDDMILSIIGYGDKTFRLNSINEINTETNETNLQKASGFCSISDTIKCHVDGGIDISGQVGKTYKIK